MQYSSWGLLVADYERAILSLYDRPQQQIPAYGIPVPPPGPELVRRAEAISRTMAERVLRVNAASWREAAMKSTRAKEMYRALSAEVNRTGVWSTIQQISRRNAKLIRSVPRAVSEEITRKSTELQLAGERHETLQEKLREIAPHLTRTKIRLIARTEISRAETDITVARARGIGIEWGQWRSSNDQRVRPSHRLMNKVLVKFSDPPDPEILAGEKSNAGHYLAGQTYNCRCVLLPVATLDEIEWPARVYTAGRIRRMNRPQFAKMIGARAGKAA